MECYLWNNGLFNSMLLIETNSIAMDRFYDRVLRTADYCGIFLRGTPQRSIRRTEGHTGCSWLVGDPPTGEAQRDAAARPPFPHAAESANPCWGRSNVLGSRPQ